MSAHTPGPWVVEQIGVGRSTYFDVLKFTDDENDAQLIARIEVDANDGGKATASLIAAAPELLAELKCVLASFADEPRIGSVLADKIRRAWFDRARAAIAKAEGTV